MTWDSFMYFAMGAVICWASSAVLAFRARKAVVPAVVCACGSAIFGAFILGLWLTLERPPMRTMGETRLWYSLFVSLIGLFIFLRYRYNWILSFSAVLSIVFVCVNLFKPEIHNANLMPALRSPWFVPHVIVYMFAYALMGAATLFAVYLWIKSRRQDISEEISVCDNLVRVGWIFLTMGIVMGALWARQAWGDSWAWDPKETWAAATWMTYLLYLHARPSIKDSQYGFALLILAFLMLQMCWYGINYLPAAQGMSVHTY